MFKILICGDREWDDKETMELWIRHYAQIHRGHIIVIHGACRGADLMAEEICKEIQLPYWGYPARWDQYKRAAGPIRNREMYRLQPDLVLAFHNDIENSKGTANMLTLAGGPSRKAQIVMTGDIPLGGEI